MQRFTALILSFLMLLSSTGITYAEHYCGSHKMMSEFTIGHAELHCGMSLPADGCETQQMMDCCDNHYLSITTDDDFAKVAFDFAPLAVFVQPDQIVFNAEAIAIASKEIQEVPHYRPPPDKISLFILYQSYLI